MNPPPQTPPDVTLALTLVRVALLLLPIMVMGILQVPKSQGGKLVALILVTLLLAVASNVAGLVWPDYVAQILRVAATASVVVLCLVIWPRSAAPEALPRPGEWPQPAAPKDGS